jgi:hypothetical protein
MSSPEQYLQIVTSMKGLTPAWVPKTQSMLQDLRGASTAQVMVPCRELGPDSTWDGDAAVVARFNSDTLPNFLEESTAEVPMTAWQVEGSGGYPSASQPRQIPILKQERQDQIQGGKTYICLILRILLCLPNISVFTSVTLEMYICACTARALNKGSLCDP